MSYKVGYVQFSPSLCDLDQTLHDLDALFSENFEADLLVLPELVNSGYMLTSKKQALENSESVDQSRYIDYLKKISLDKNCALVSGFNEQTSNQMLFNSSVIVKDGKVLGVYRKPHLFNLEKDIYEPGDGPFRIYDINGLKVGMLVCHDWRYVEAWRTLALMGADIICLPAAMGDENGGHPYAHRALRAHALLSRVYVILCNRTGVEQDNIIFMGKSAVLDILGNSIIESERETTLEIVEIDPEIARNKQLNPKNNIFKDRRPDLYQL